jgi:alpha-glucuronidase
MEMIQHTRIDEEEFNNVKMLLKIQYEKAVKWRDGFGALLSNVFKITNS